MKSYLLPFFVGLLTACGAGGPLRGPDTQTATHEAQESKIPPVVCPVVVPSAPVSVADEVSELLDYYQRARQLSPVELAKEQLATAQQLAGHRTDKLQLQQAMLFLLSRGSSDLNRALTLVDSVMSSKEPESPAFKPLASLLWVQLNEQRRLNEQIEKLQNQLKEEQKRSAALQERFDAAQQKLEGLKAIEKSLINRPQGTKP